MLSTTLKLLGEVITTNMLFIVIGTTIELFEVSGEEY